MNLPPLGFGGAAIGNLYRPIEEGAAIDAVSAAIEAGLLFFDTAPLYGFGLSERRIGAALRRFPERKAEMLVSTKVGRRLEPLADASALAERHGFVAGAPFEPVFDYGYDGVMRSFEESCVRLGRRRIDILLAHDLGRATHGRFHAERYRDFMEGGYRAMRELRDTGAVGAIGLGANEWEICSQALGDADFDLFLLAGRYTLLEQDPLDGFLPLCARRNVRVVIGGPYNSGILVAGEHYNYRPAPPAIVERVRRLRAAAEEFGVELAAAALQFPLAHPQVASVIPGMAGRGEVDESLRLIRQPIPAGFWQSLRDQGLLRPDAPIPAATRFSDE